MKVSLEEALKRAMEGPLTCRKGDDSVLGQFYDIEKSGKHVGCGGAGENGPKAVDRNRCTFALLVHAFNLFPEVVEELRLAISLLQDARLVMDKDREKNLDEWLPGIENTLAKAETIELPE
jgi:hypothetical protein